MADAARAYLFLHGNPFWRWHDAGEVIAWNGGTTITFRGELASVLQRLAPDGLPHFGSLLLLLAASRESWRPSSAESAQWKRTYPNELAPLVDDVLSGLERVHQLQARFHGSPQARAVMAEIVFEGTRGRLPPGDSARVVGLLENGPDEELLASGRIVVGAGVEAEVAVPRRELQAFAKGLRRLEATTLEMRLHTGLDMLPKAALLELPAAEQVRALLHVLDGDTELGGIARLAKSLMAAVSLPRSIADDEEIPTGGVSDIANRGPLDRLLLSELAHDDLVLAVRVALNEALYLRRETPPRTPTRQRAILLDSGLRSWGVPRVFAAAVALALAATTGRHAESVAYRAQGRRLQPVTLNTRAGLIKHLSALEPDLHPGSAIGAFCQATDEAGGAAEQVLVTTEEVVADVEFQRALATDARPPFYVIALHRAGRLRLLECRPRGSKLIREAHLDLADLLAEPSSSGSSLIDRDRADDLPAISLAEPFPLLLSHQFDPKQIRVLDSELALAIAPDRRLMLWSKAKRGARQLAAVVPRGVFGCHCFDREGRQIRAVLQSSPSDRSHLLRIDLKQMRCDIVPLNLPRGVKAVCSHGGVWLVIDARQVIVLSQASGEWLQELQLPTDMMWRRDRFFFSNLEASWYALGFDGHTARLERVFSEAQELRIPRLLMLFDQPGADGPIAVTARGDLFSSATENLRTVRHELSPPVSFVDISDDGQRLIFEEARAKPMATPARATMCMVDTTNLQVQHLQHADRRAQLRSYSFIQTLNLRHRFVAVFVDSDGVLTLISRKQQPLGIVLQETSNSICLCERRKVAVAQHRAQAFKPLRAPSDPEAAVGYCLSVAAWEDGSRAYLDSRGLLHLKSSDSAIAETSLVLRDGTLSGWCSDGRWWGRPYFIDDREASADAEIFETAIRPFVERLRSCS